MKSTHRKSRNCAGHRPAPPPPPPTAMRVVWVGSPIRGSRVGEGNIHQSIWGTPRSQLSGEHIESDPNLRPYTAEVPLLVRPSFLSEPISSNTATGS